MLSMPMNRRATVLVTHVVRITPLCSGGPGLLCEKDAPKGSLQLRRPTSSVEANFAACESETLALKDCS